MEPAQSEANNRNNLITLLIVGVSLILILLQVGTNLLNDYRTKQNHINKPAHVGEVADSKMTSKLLIEPHHSYKTL